MAMRMVKTTGTIKWINEAKGFGLITPDGEVTDETTEQFLRDFMTEFEQFIVRVLTVLPRPR